MREGVEYAEHGLATATEFGLGPSKGDSNQDARFIWLFDHTASLQVNRQHLKVSTMLLHKCAFREQF